MPQTASGQFPVISGAPTLAPRVSRNLVVSSTWQFPVVRGISGSGFAADVICVSTLSGLQKVGRPHDPWQCSHFVLA
jgi:hypothetical protein